MALLPQSMGGAVDCRKCRQVNGERNEGGTGMLCRVGPIKPVPADMVVAGHVSGLLIRNLN